MLVLTRKNMESVVVGGSDRFERMLKVTVLEIKNGSVRLGFEANASVPIHRSEVWDRIRESNGADGSHESPATDMAG
jgi:carbon storage regulator CsrA